MKQFNASTVVVLALITVATGCRTTDGLRWRGFDLGKKEISADALTIAETELPPPSAASLPNRPLLGKAKSLTSDATKSVANTVQNATDQVRKTTTDVVDKAKSYPATAYPKFQAKSDPVQPPSIASTNAAAPNSVTAPSMPTPNIPNLKAPVIARNQPASQASLPDISGDTKASVGTNYATGPYSTYATTIPSQPLQQNEQTATPQQGYYNPEFTPTMSSRRSTMTSDERTSDERTSNERALDERAPNEMTSETMPPSGAPNYQFPEEVRTPPMNATSSQPHYPQTHAYPQPNAPQHYPTTAAPISQATAISPMNSNAVHGVAPANFNSPTGYNAPATYSQPAPNNRVPAANANPVPNSFYDKPNPSSNWRPGSTGQGNLNVPVTSASAAAHGAIAGNATGCTNGVCNVPPDGSSNVASSNAAAVSQFPPPQQPQTYPSTASPATYHQTAHLPAMANDGRESNWR